MKSRSSFLFGFISAFLAVLAGGCVNFAALDDGAVGPLAWIDAPLHGSALPLAPFEVVSHAGTSLGIAAFELSVNDQVYAFDEAPPDQAGQTLVNMSQLWDPGEPGTYHLSVRAQDVMGVFGPAAEVEVTIGEIEESVTAETPAPTPTGTPTPTEESGECIYTAVVNLFCRTGPGPQYPEIDTFIPGLSAPIVGQSSDGFYWYVIGPYNNLMCTVPEGAQYGEVSGDCSQAPLFTPIPVPPTPTPTSTPTCAPGVAGC